MYNNKGGGAQEGKSEPHQQPARRGSARRRKNKHKQISFAAFTIFVSFVFLAFAHK